MALYTTRIEILQANDDGIYHTLSQAMEAEGFLTAVQLAAISPVYHLPGGEYNWIGEMNIALVLEAALRAVTQVTNQVRILITKVDSITDKRTFEEVK